MKFQYISYWKGVSHRSSHDSLHGTRQRLMYLVYSFHKMITVTLNSAGD